jgi:hypothetical protein
MALDFRLHPLPSAAVSAALPRGHAALAFVDVEVGFVDRATAVFAVGFIRIYGFYIHAMLFCYLMTLFPQRSFQLRVSSRFLSLHSSCFRVNFRPVRLPRRIARGYGFIVLLFL